MAPEADGDGDDQMAPLETLMLAVAAGALPDRGLATTYSQHRAALLATPGLVLPGFVHQCLTVFKLRDFITLYDPDVAVREAFVRRAFARCRMAAVDLPADRPASARTDPTPRWKF